VDADGLIVLVNAQTDAGHRQRYMSDGRPRPMAAGVRLAGRRRDGAQFPAEISLSS
jgi:hypothetical protein